MIGMKIAGPLEKICKVPWRVADEASEQRGSYSKVNRERGMDSQIVTGATPEAGNPN